MTKDEIRAFCERIRRKIELHGLPARPLSDEDKERVERMRAIHNSEKK